MLKYTFFLCLIFYSSHVIAQETNWLKDPVYSKGILLDEASILYNETESIIIDTNGIKPFHPISDHFHIPYTKKALVEIKGKVYLLQEDLSINLDEGIEMDINALSNDGEHLDILGNVIVYIANDSIFVDNFKSPRKTFVTKGMVPKLENDKYLLLEKEERKVYYIFDMRQRKLKRLPAHGEQFSTSNEYFIVYLVFDIHGEFYLEVLDRNLNKIIDKSEGYDLHTSNANYLTINGYNKKPKYWHKLKEVKLPSSVENVDLLFDTGISIVMNDKQQYGIMNEYGEIIHSYKFNSALSEEYPIKSILGINRHYSCVFDEYGNLMFEGKFFGASYVCEDRFEVHKSFSLTKLETYLVNTKNELIIKKENNSSYAYRNRYGIPYILDYSNGHNIRTIDGEIIVTWQSKRNEPTSYESGYPGLTWKMIRSLTQQQLDKFNPTDFWIRDKKENGVLLLSVENHLGKQLTTWYKYLKNYNGSNVFIVKTQNDKYGVLKISE